MSCRMGGGGGLLFVRRPLRRRLNEATTPDHHPIPHIQDFAVGLAGKRVFSKVDLVRGYHPVPVAPKDVQKTAIITPFDLFEFLRTPFDLRNAAQTFQRLRVTVCLGLKFAIVYLDDILVASANEMEHIQHLHRLFQRLSEHGLVLYLSMCRFGKCTLLSSVIHPRAGSARWYCKICNPRCLTPFTVLPTLVQIPPSSLSHQSLYGTAWPNRCVTGLAHVWSIREPRCTGTYKHPQKSSNAKAKI